MILIDYHLTRAYRLFSPNDNKVMISRNVQFNESKGVKWLKVSNNLLQNDEGSNHINNTLQNEQVNKMV